MVDAIDLSNRSLQEARRWIPEWGGPTMNLVSLADLAGLVLFRRCLRPLWLAGSSTQIGPMWRFHLEPRTHHRGWCLALARAAVCGGYRRGAPCRWCLG